MRAVGVYDPPPGDGVENNQYLPLATDGKLATAWTTQWYLSEHFGGHLALTKHEQENRP